MTLSFSKNRWRLKPEAPESLYAEKPDIHRVILQLLYNRKIENIEDFLKLDYDTQVHDPFLFKNMKKAVKRLFQAIKKNEKIVIHGDYDADGICGAAILSTTLEVLGGNPEVFLPLRERDGYGMSMHTVEKLAKENTKIIITCDCGISNIEETRRANDLGMDVIITDHHQFKEKLPPAFAILHPSVPKATYPDKTLSGGGVAFKLAQGLLKYAEDINWPTCPEDIKQFENRLLELATISSVADMVPLLGETRSLVREGLKILNNTKRLGLIALINESREELGKLNARSIAFGIAPRLNAPGRLKDPRPAFDLITTQDRGHADRLVTEINAINLERRKITEIALKQARVQVEREIQNKQPILFAYSSEWPSGIVGLVAGKLKDEYNRAALVMADRGGEIVGSGRSVETLNIVQAMECVPQYLEKFGGHPQACGFSLKDASLLPYFEEDLIKAVHENTEYGLSVPTQQIDAEISLSDISWELVESLASLEPHGKGNEEPVFMTSSIQITSARSVGNNSKTLIIEGRQNSKIRKFVWFGKAEFVTHFSLGDYVDICYTIGINEWNGSREIQLSIKDMRASRVV